MWPRDRIGCGEPRSRLDQMSTGAALGLPLGHARLAERLRDAPLALLRGRARFPIRTCAPPRSARPEVHLVRDHHAPRGDRQRAIRRSATGRRSTAGTTASPASAGPAVRRRSSRPPSSASPARSASQYVSSVLLGERKRRSTRQCSPCPSSAHARPSTISQPRQPSRLPSRGRTRPAGSTPYATAVVPGDA